MADGVRVTYDGVVALAGVDLEVRARQILGLIGPNGAGKTSLVNVLSGFERPAAGGVWLGDKEITSWSADRRTRRGVARTFQACRPFAGLSVSENVEVGALAAGLSEKEARRHAALILGVVGLDARSAVAAGALAYGEERLLGIARALSVRPAFLLLDEPAAGLDEQEIPAFSAALHQVRQTFGCGILLIDHNVRLILEICDAVQVLDQGMTIALGSPDAVRQDPGVIAAYLGESAA